MNYLWCAWREVRRRKARAVLLAAGYALAVALAGLFSVWLATDREAVRAVLERVGTHFVAFVPRGETAPAVDENLLDPEHEGFVAAGLPCHLMPVRLGAAANGLPDVAEAVPFLSFSFRAESQPARVMEIPPAGMPVVLGLEHIGLEYIGLEYKHIAGQCDPCAEIDRQMGDTEEARKLKTAIRAQLNAPLFPLQPAVSGPALTVGGLYLASRDALATTCCAETDLIAGRFLRSDDRGLVLLDEACARGRSWEVGDTIRIAERAYAVAGIVNPGIRPARADIYLPWDEMLALVRTRLKAPPSEAEMSMLLVESKSAGRQKSAIAQVKRLVPDAVVLSYACYRPAAAVIGMQARTVALLIVVIGLAAVLLAAKSQAASVIERRHDIGILRTLGWTPGEIVVLMLWESFLPALAGGLVGILALGVILGATSSFSPSGISLNAWVVWRTAGLALGAAILGGLAAGIIPAWHAARLTPAAALRRR